VSDNFACRRIPIKGSAESNLRLELRLSRNRELWATLGPDPRGPNGHSVVLFELRRCEDQGIPRVSRPSPMYPFFLNRRAARALADWILRIDRQWPPSSPAA
jgi:hypothetical protein